MRKLFKLKEWLTVPDTAQHLSIVFAEDVTEAEVLRLALDGQLQLSVRFVNSTMALKGKKVPITEAKYEEVPSLDGERIVRLYGGPVLLFEGVESFVVNQERTAVNLTGVFDLPMFGSERLEIELLYEGKTDGPDVTAMCLDGAFVEANGFVYQLQESMEDKEYEDCSDTKLEKLKQHIVDSKIGAAEAEKLLNLHHEKRKALLMKRGPNPRRRTEYCTAAGLPVDSVLVVRTDVLREFEQSVNGAPIKSNEPLKTRERNTYLSIIAVLCKEAKLDYTKPAKTAAQIRVLAALMGLSIGETTIEGILKKIPDALETRME